MKKHIKKCFAVILSFCCLVSAIPVSAAKTTCTTYSGSNVESQNYSRWSSTVKSYLSACSDGSLMRVQYVSSEKKVLVEYYDEAYNIDESRSRFLPEELPIFGGFYETDSCYFLVTGQENPDESADVEVFRITKYDKQWNRLGSAGLYDCNTTVPFDAGSLRMDDAGKYLLIRTSHEMYASDDGLNHQANVTIQLDMETMEITDSYTEVMNSGYGYISHSFNQFIKVEDNKIVSLDHGDAHPRSLALLKYQTDVSTGKFVPGYTNRCELVSVLTFPGATGQNATGAAAGGFEISDSSYLVAGHSVVQDESNLTRSTRNVFVASVDKATSAATMNWLTSYEEGDGTTSTPQMVRISDDEYLILWSRDGQVSYTKVDGQGSQISETYSLEGSLSDCVPIVVNGKAVWYTWKDGTIVFYEIPLNQLGQPDSATIENGHHYENQGITDGYASLKCTECGHEKQVAVATSISCLWNENGGGYYSSVFPREKEEGEKIYYWIQYSPSGADSEIEVISSDPEIVSVTGTSATRGYLTMNKPGNVTLTIRPKLNPTVSKTFSLTVKGETALEVSSFTVSPDANQYVDFGVTLKAQATGGSGSYQYRFSMMDESQRNTVLQEYGASNTCQWIPETAGEVTLKVEVKDEKGQTAERLLEGYQVNKLPAAQKDEIVKTYRYTVGADSERISIPQYLTESLRDAVYQKEVQDPSGILNQVSIDSEGLLAYQVKNTGSAGDEAWVHVTVSSSNYEDLKVSVHIILSDKEKVSLQEGTTVAVDGSPALTYGQRLSELTFAAGAVFVNSEGTAVEGTLSWKNPESVPAAGTESAEWVFTPTDEDAYESCSGKLAIWVEKATPQVTAPQIPDMAYDPDRQLKDIEFSGENGTAMVDGVLTEVPGTWSLPDSELVPMAGTMYYLALFTPEDSQNFEVVKTMVTIEVSKAIPEIVTIPEIGKLTYGESLGDAALQGGKALYLGKVVDGSFAFADPSITLTVKDSGTSYEILFVPEDTKNYQTVSTMAEIQVEPALTAPNMPEESIAVGYEVTQVSQISLPEGWSWDQQDGEQSLEVGRTVQARAVYQDTENYQISSLVISITRQACENHQYVSAVTKQPTIHEPGIRTYTCSICGAQYTEEIPKLPDSTETPGDASDGTPDKTPGDTTNQPPSQTPGKTEEEKPSKTEAKSVKKNRKKTIGGVIYKVTKAGKSKKAEVTVIGISGKKKRAVTIPATVRIDGVTCKVTGIGQKAFKGCSKLKKITIKTKTLKTVGKQALKGIQKKAVIKVPKAKYKTYKKLLRAKAGFQKTMKIKR